MSRRSRRGGRNNTAAPSISTIEAYFPGDTLAQSVWTSKYKATGEYDPNDMHIRMASEFARIESLYKDNEEYHEDLSDFGKSLLKRHSAFTDEELFEEVMAYFRKFEYIVPQGSIMSQLGNTESIGSLSNCFVIGQPADSYGGILLKDQELVQLMKRRGGVGIDISTLRPSGVQVSNAAQTSTGAASFMERFSNSTREVAQGGRRGALMLSIDIRHPDALEFINAKKDRTKVTGANISVMLRDDFMKAVENDEDYILRFPCEWDASDDGEIVSITSPDGEHAENFSSEVFASHDHTYGHSTGHVFWRRVIARDYYNSVVENAWENAEPGQIFVDRHHSYSPDGVYPEYRGITTNPCGEIFMQAYDACRLMALNLLSVVQNPYKEDAFIDYELLYEIAYMQQRYADDLVDLELEHILRILAKLRRDPESSTTKKVEIELWEKIYEVASSGRRTGCGFTALGDMLAAQGLSYDSEDAKRVIDEVMKTKMRAELDCSTDLAITRGTFKGWDPKKEYIDASSGGLDILGQNPFYEMIMLEFPEQFNRMLKYGRRNVSWSTVAPTGSVSILTQTTSGLEPLFAPYYIRRKKVNPAEGGKVDFTDQNGDQWTEYTVAHPQFKYWYDNHCPVLEFPQLSEGGDPPTFEELKKEELELVYKASPWYNSCAPDINWKQRVEIQGVIQKYTSHSISSTINLPNSATKEDVSDIYLHAFNKGLKGVTVYRDGCRSGVLVTEPEKPKFETKDAVKRPKSLKCDIINTVAKGKKWTVIIGILDGKPYEVFVIEGHEIKETPGQLVKVSRGVYNVITDKGTYENVTAGMSAEEEAITRLTSTCLRHGAETTFIVEQLDKSHGDITSFGKALARTLKKYVSDDKLNARASTCPNCETGELVFEEGCKQCKSCGYSAC